MKNMEDEIMKHFENITNNDLKSMACGEYFTYRRNGFFRKGVVVSNNMMVPMGLACYTIEIARKQL